MAEIEKVLFEGEPLEVEDFITITDEDGADSDWCILDILRYNGKVFAVLEDENASAEDVMILELDVNENGEVNDLLIPENDDIAGEVFEEFKKRNA